METARKGGKGRGCLRSTVLMKRAGWGGEGQVSTERTERQRQDGGFRERAEGLRGGWRGHVERGGAEGAEAERLRGLGGDRRAAAIGAGPHVEPE